MIIFFFKKNLRRALAWRSRALAHSFPLVFSSVVSSILCTCADTRTITFGSRKTQHICSVISHVSGPDLWERPLVRLVREIGSEERRHGRRSVTSPSSTTSAVSTAEVEQQTNAHTQSMNAMAEMVRVLQIGVRASAESKFLAKDKESTTTKRAFTMPPHYSGKVEEYETWRFQLVEWIENDLGSENQQFTGVQEKNLEHEDAVRDVCADHSNPPTPQENKEEMKLV